VPTSDDELDYLAVTDDKQVHSVFTAPYPPDLLLKHPGVRAPVAPKRAPFGDLKQRGTQSAIVCGGLGLVALGGAVLPDAPTRSALAETQALARHRDRRRAEQFPRTTPYSELLFSTWSLTIGFSRAFSRPSFLKRLTSLALLHPTQPHASDASSGCCHAKRHANR